MKPILPEFTIVSVYRSENKESVNEHNHGEVLEGLKLVNVGFKELIGKYEGETEKSILIVGKKASKLAKMIANKYKQDWYLYCDQDRNAEIVSIKNGTRENIGVFKEILPIKAAELSLYTYDPLFLYAYDPLAKKYYSCG